MHLLQETNVNRVIINLRSRSLLKSYSVLNTDLKRKMVFMELGRNIVHLFINRNNIRPKVPHINKKIIALKMRY